MENFGLDSLWQSLFPSAMAATGVPPPATPSSAPLQLTVNPLNPVTLAGGAGGNPDAASGAAPDVGASLEPAQSVGSPLSLAPPYPGSTGSPTPAPRGAGLADALKGVKIPPPPEAQKVSTPHGPPAPRTPIQSGELLQLLTALQLAGQRNQQQIPMGLGQALRG